MERTGQLKDMCLPPFHTESVEKMYTDEQSEREARVDELQETVMPEPIPKQFLDTHCELRLLFSWLARSGDPQASARDLCFVAIALAKLRPSSLMCHNISHSM